MAMKNVYRVQIKSYLCKELNSQLLRDEKIKNFLMILVVLRMFAIELNFSLICIVYKNLLVIYRVVQKNSRMLLFVKIY